MIIELRTLATQSSSLDCVALLLLMLYLMQLNSDLIEAVYRFFAYGLIIEPTDREKKPTASNSHHRIAYALNAKILMTERYQI